MSRARRFRGRPHAPQAADLARQLDVIAAASLGLTPEEAATIVAPGWGSSEEADMLAARALELFEAVEGATPQTAADRREIEARRGAEFFERVSKMGTPVHEIPGWENAKKKLRWVPTLLALVLAICSLFAPKPAAAAPVGSSHNQHYVN